MLFIFQNLYNYNQLITQSATENRLFKNIVYVVNNKVVERQKKRTKMITDWLRNREDLFQFFYLIAN